MAGRINVKGIVSLSDGFTANGTVSLTNAQIGGVLDCGAGSFIRESDDALEAEGINVKGDVLLRRDRNTKGTEIPFTALGTVRLLNAYIEGQLDCSGGIFTFSPNHSRRDPRIAGWRSRPAAVS